jgi:flagella basal body P-ring formation protein FlgA
MIVIRALSRGAVAGTRDVAPTPCSAAPVALSLRYDPTIRAMRTTRDLSVGETLPAIPAFALPAIRPGDRLRLVAQVGAVTVERQVTALQAGQAGAPLFVRAADGAVFTATFREIAP